MKTYSRKKSDENQDEQEIILDINELCRLCMGKETELVSIFNNEESLPLTLRIMACVSLEVFEGDGMPDKICISCKQQLEKSYTFRKKCESSDSKLKQLVRSIKGSLREENLDDSDDSQERDMEIDDTLNSSGHEEPQTEEELIGVTQVAYIQPDSEPIDPHNITLSDSDMLNKDACTLKNTIMKRETIDEEEEDNQNESIYFIDRSNEDNIVDDNNMDAIADAVKATLASQPGLNLGGQLQLKVNSSEGKTTQVEVTTEDGSVIIMELMTEDASDLMNSTAALPPAPTKSNHITSDGELAIFKCPDCPKSFSRRIQLRRHASVHMQQRGFSCGMCEKWFPTRSALIRHERIHTGERPFQCEICNKSFAQKEILFRHLMTHTGEKPYNCPHCPRGFTQKEPLKAHMKTHLTASAGDILLHYCSLCPKVFCHASGLSRHLLTHTGKTFKCGACDKAFTDKSSLRRHYRQSGHQEM